MTRGGGGRSSLSQSAEFREGKVWADLCSGVAGVGVDVVAVVILEVGASVGPSVLSCRGIGCIDCHMELHKA